MAIQDFLSEGFGRFENQAFDLASQLTDFTSPFNQQFRSFLGSVTPTGGTDSLLAGLQAGGGNFANSSFLAGKQNEAFQKRRTDFLNTTVKGFAAGNVGQVGGLLNVGLQAHQQPRSNILENRGLDIQDATNQGGLFDFLAPIAGSLAANFFLPGFGGSLASAAIGRNP